MPGRIRFVPLDSDKMMKAKTRRNILSLFKPKDVVSGDFYQQAWRMIIYRRNSRLRNRHGVPNCVWSLLNISKLSRSKTKKGSTVRTKSHWTLCAPKLLAFNPGRKHRGKRDGMDVPLCAGSTRSNPLLNLLPPTTSFIVETARCLPAAPIKCQWAKVTTMLVNLRTTK